MKSPPPRPYGYARVSTDGQSVDAQVRQLTKAGCKKVFREVASGAKTDRAQLRRLLGQLEAGDVLTVTRLDRLARSTRDLLNTLATITGKKAGFRSLGDAWADTTTSHGRLMLTVLGGLAEFERDLIRARTGEGRERAKARGVKMGRKPKLTPHQRQEILAARRTARPCGRSPAATTSTTARFRDWREGVGEPHGMASREITSWICSMNMQQHSTITLLATRLSALSRKPMSSGWPNMSARQWFSRLSLWRRISISSMQPTMRLPRLI